MKGDKDPTVIDTFNIVVGDKVRKYYVWMFTWNYECSHGSFNVHMKDIYFDHSHQGLTVDQNIE
jgi:hypothetical protein